jgi:hypothetical protein
MCRWLCGGLIPRSMHTPGRHGSRSAKRTYYLRRERPGPGARAASSSRPLDVEQCRCARVLRRAEAKPEPKARLACAAGTAGLGCRPRGCRASDECTGSNRLRIGSREGIREAAPARSRSAGRRRRSRSVVGVRRMRRECAGSVAGAGGAGSGCASAWARREIRGAIRWSRAALPRVLRDGGGEAGTQGALARAAGYHRSVRSADAIALHGRAGSSADLGAEVAMFHSARARDRRFAGTFNVHKATIYCLGGCFIKSVRF